MFEVKHAADKLSQSEKDKLMSKCDAAGEWLDNNTTAEKKAYEHKLAEFNKFCSPMMTHM